MKTTKLFGFVLASLAILSVAGCQKQEEKVPGFDTATFEATVSGVSDYAATVSVSVTGNDASPWYGFLTDNVTAKPEDVVSSYIGSLNVNKHILKTGNATIPLENLARGKAYRYIVTGLTAAGFTYGTPAVAEFTTTGDYVYTSLTKDPNISIELGYNADSTKSVISIKGTSGYYDFDYMTESAFKKLYASTEEYAFARIDSLKAWGADLTSRLKSGDADYVVDLFPGNTNIVAVVYSVTQNYNAAGTYADAVLSRKISLVSTGYAGAPRGRANCCDLKRCIRQELGVQRGERYELCRSVHAEANCIISAARRDMIGGTLFLVGIEGSDGAYVKNAAPCAMCKRLIINAGIKNVIVRDSKNDYHEFSVDEWISNDESLAGSAGY